MRPTVFFSWQSDLDRDLNRDFIRNALEGAMEQLADLEVPLRVDEATQDVAGTPEIAPTIFQKLTETAVAVFDVTPVGENSTGKALPNPNVLLELGFAGAQIGWDRLILVMNTGSGFDPNRLPFDLRNRRFPICYSFPKLARHNRKQIQKVFWDLCLTFRQSIRDSLGTVHLAVERARGRMSRDCALFIDAFGEREAFHWPHAEHQDELHRLLDIGLLRYDLNPAENLYAYHWTYLGREVCRWYFSSKKVGVVKLTQEHVQAVESMLKR